MHYRLSATLLLATCTALSCAPAAFAQTPAGQTVYDDNLASGWLNWSWCGVDFHSKDYVHTGATSIKVTLGAWQGFYLDHDAFSALTLDSLTFWINGGATQGRNITVSAVVGGSGQPGVSLNTYVEGGAVAANAWRKVTIPLSALGANNVTNLTGFWIMDGSGKAQAPFYVDDIAFTIGSAPQPVNNGVNVNVDASANRHAISPLVYGVAYGTSSALADLNCPLNRLGGNNTSRYNWLQNADNRGSDWYFESIGDKSATAGERGDTFISNSQKGGAQPMLTIPMVGYVAKLGANRNKLASFSIAKYGAQTGNDSSWMKDAGNGISSKTKQYITGNNPADANIPADSAFQQNWVKHIVSTWGTADKGGLRYYLLDNEPSLWQGTHRDVHPTGATMQEIYDKTVAYADKIHAVDPKAQVVGPEEWGWSGYFYSGYDQQYGGIHGWSSLPDRKAHNGADYLPWLLDQLHTHDMQTGKRSLDVFTVHFYPQGGEFGNDVSPNMQLRRNRSTRALWDPTYVDQTWINDKVQLVPRLKAWVNSYYPGLQTGVTEYSWGADGHINGATTEADILGIFGREGLDLATRWVMPAVNTPTYNAMKMYRNYDGNKSGFGDVSVDDSTPNPDNVASFAALRSSDGALTVMVVSKGLSGNTPVALNLTNFADGGKAQAWQLTAANAITRLADLSLANGKTQITVPAQSITLLVIPHK